MKTTRMNRWALFALGLLSGVTGVLFWAAVQSGSERQVSGTMATVPHAPFDFDTYGSTCAWPPPVDRYLVARSWLTPLSLQQDIRNYGTWDSICASGHPYYLGDALTTGLEAHIAKDGGLSLERSLELVHWAHELFVAQDLLPATEAQYFRIIGRHWLSYVANDLAEKIEEDANLKYEPRVQHMLHLLNTKGFYPGVGWSNTEKVVRYLTEGKYGYVLNRFLYGTGMLPKLAVASLIVLQALGLACVVGKFNRKPIG